MRTLHCTSDRLIRCASWKTEISFQSAPGFDAPPLLAYLATILDESSATAGVRLTPWHRGFVSQTCERNNQCG